MGDIVFVDSKKRVLTNSLKIAEIFEKRHSNVLRDIVKLDCSRKFNELNFEHVEYVDVKGEVRPAYDITKNGFVFLVMGYRGEKAAKFKEDYIDLFDKMESVLKRQSISRLTGIETRKSMTDKIKDTGENERMHGHGYSTYTKLAYKLIGIKYKKPANNERFRDGLCAEDLDRLETVEDMIKSLLKAGKEYGDIKELK